MNLPKSFREIQEKRFNNTLFKQDIVWNGESTKAEIEIPVTIQPVLIAIDNVQGQALTVTFEQLIKQTPFSDNEPLQFSGGMDDTWAPLYDSEGNELSLEIDGGTAQVFGPFDYFPRFLGGKITLTAESAPATDGLTTVIVQEV